MNIYVISILFAYVTSTTSLNPGDFQMCGHQTPCQQLRGLIFYSADSMTPFERHMFRGRSWIIRPTPGNQETTVAMAFKDFYIKSSVYVITTSSDGTRWRQLRNDLESDFEIILTNVTSVSIFVPRSETGTFQAYYYVGCGILTAESGEIKFPTLDEVDGVRSTCWIVKPPEVPNRKRIYLSVRNAYLLDGASIRIEDLHSSQRITNISSYLPYDVFGAETTGNEMILLDLSCGSKLGTCEDYGNLFTASYYAVTGDDVMCIEAQKQCVDDPENVIGNICKLTCPAIEHIIEEEFKKEEVVLKSGIAANMKQENATKAEDMENQGEEEEDSHDKRLGPPTAKPKKKSCKLPRNMCRCLRIKNGLNQYCFSKRSCSAYGKCALACGYSKIAFCWKIRSQQMNFSFGQG